MVTENKCYLCNIKTQTNMETKNLFKSLAEFQQKVPVIYKDSQAYGYKYADLPAIFEVINPIMQECGLGFTQIINGTSLKTIIFHIETGEMIESNIDIPQGADLKGMNPFQVLGSAITYLRRYAISSMLGLVTDKDTDTAGEQVKPSATPKPKLDTDSENYTMALNAVTNGSFTVAKIKSKYELTPAAEKALNEAETGFKAQTK